MTKDEMTPELLPIEDDALTFLRQIMSALETELYKEADIVARWKSRKTITKQDIYQAAQVLSIKNTGIRYDA